LNALRNKPAYIPSRTFALVINQLAQLAAPVSDEVEVRIANDAATAAQAAAIAAQAAANANPALQAAADQAKAIAEAAQRLAHKIAVALHNAAVLFVDAAEAQAAKDAATAAQVAAATAQAALLAAPGNAGLQTAATEAQAKADAAARLAQRVAADLEGAALLAAARTAQTNLTAAKAVNPPPANLAALQTTADNAALAAAKAAARQTARTLIGATGIGAPLPPPALEKWFDDAMTGVTGWYKRKSHTVNLVLGISLAVILNVDTFMLTQFLWYNPAVRETIVKAAENATKRAPPKLGDDTAEPAARIKDMKAALKKLGAKADLEKQDAENLKKLEAELQALDKRGTEKKPNDAVAADIKNLETKVLDFAKKADPPKTSDDPVADIKKLQVQLQGLGVPVGWKGRSGENKTPDLREPPQLDDSSGWISKFFGLLVTGMAVSLGAPFWFDLLKSLNTMRTTGKPPETAEQRSARAS
jgi:hypothetical protein